MEEVYNAYKSKFNYNIREPKSICGTKSNQLSRKTILSSNVGLDEKREVIPSNVAILKKYLMELQQHM